MLLGLTLEWLQDAIITCDHCKTDSTSGCATMQYDAHEKHLEDVFLQTINAKHK